MPPGRSWRTFISTLTEDSVIDGTPYCWERKPAS